MIMIQQHTPAQADFPVDEKFMRRALSLALNGKGFASPNPMVGAVIVAPDGRIIGEGWHRRCGSGHAEVNAVASVAEADRPLLRESTMYVTLEPCSHYGKTPPCARLIIETGIPRVVVATVDPFAKVAGRGISMLRDAGVEVAVGMLGEESRRLNRRFFTAHTLGRPFVTLKWAQSIDGWMDHERTPESPAAYRFSTPETTVDTMRLRSLHDAILTTSQTVMQDDSRLTIRGWDGLQPLRVVLDRNGRLTGNEAVFRPVEGYDSRNTPETLRIAESDIETVLKKLYSERGVTSVLIEAGPTLLNELIARNLWDAARVETSPLPLASAGRIPAPAVAPSKPIPAPTKPVPALLYGRGMPRPYSPSSALSDPSDLSDSSDPSRISNPFSPNLITHYLNPTPR